jgi:hypothetical protein
VRPLFTTSSNSRALASQRVAQPLQRGDQVLVDRDARRDVHRRGDHVVGALPHVDVIVRVHRGPALTPTGPRGLAITSLAFMLVEVPLPVWKMSSTNWSSHRPLDHLLGRLSRWPPTEPVQLVQLHVGQGRRLLDHGAQRRDEAAREAEVADREVLDRALRLRAYSASAGTFISPSESRSVR